MRVCVDQASSGCKNQHSPLLMAVSITVATLTADHHKGCCTANASAGHLDAISIEATIVHNHKKTHKSGKCGGASWKLKTVVNGQQQ